MRAQNVSVGQTDFDVSELKNVRALHFVTFNITPDRAKALIRMGVESDFNTIILGIGWRGGIHFNSMPWLKGTREGKKKPWSTGDLVEVVSYARTLGLTVIPQLLLLSHQKKFIGKQFPELLYNSATYDPRMEEVYSLIYPILDEVIELINPIAIHIGHDEVVGWKQKHFDKGILGKGENILPPDLFLKDTLRIYNYLKAKKVQTWMWGDMLVSHNEFPLMHGSGLHGNIPGYGKELRDKLPRDIVISHWHYFDKRLYFPTVKVFLKEGFRVLGATWKSEDNIVVFSKYAAENNANGMISTLWYHVQENNLDFVSDLIKFSGEQFHKNFSEEI